MRRLLTQLSLPVFDYIHTRDDVREIEILGRPFRVYPGVYNPRFSRLLSFPSSEHLASHLDVPRDAKVLDMGTGIGVQAVFAAQNADQVIATDINPVAVSCAACNAELNGVGERVEVRRGDLFEPVREERFDLIVWLPPSFPIDPALLRHHGWMCGADGKVLHRFCNRVRHHLRPGGRILFSCVDRNRDFILSRLRKKGFACRRLGRRLRRFPLNSVTVHEARLLEGVLGSA